jgi:hypothetical protein
MFSYGKLRLQRVQVLMAGQSQDYKIAKVVLCKFYSKNHCEENLRQNRKRGDCPLFILRL